MAAFTYNTQNAYMEAIADTIVKYIHAKSDIGDESRLRWKLHLTNLDDPHYKAQLLSLLVQMVKKRLKIDEKSYPVIKAYGEYDIFGAEASSE